MAWKTLCLAHGRFAQLQSKRDPISVILFKRYLFKAFAFMSSWNFNFEREKSKALPEGGYFSPQLHSHPAGVVVEGVYSGISPGAELCLPHVLKKPFLP